MMRIMSQNPEPVSLSRWLSLPPSELKPAITLASRDHFYQLLFFLPAALLFWENRLLGWTRVGVFSFLSLIRAKRRSALPLIRHCVLLYICSHFGEDFVFPIKLAISSELQSTRKHNPKRGIINAVTKWCYRYHHKANHCKYGKDVSTWGSSWFFSFLTPP